MRRNGGHDGRAAGAQSRKTKDADAVVIIITIVVLRVLLRNLLEAASFGSCESLPMMQRFRVERSYLSFYLCREKQKHFPDATCEGDGGGGGSNTSTNVYFTDFSSKRSYFFFL